MSLHNLANHLQSAGRGEDKVLVHMTPGEVQGLQSLAMAHGGSLTINPQTGLPEAGILSALLPIVAGAFLGPAGLGLSAMQTGLAVGALGTAATGSLGKGLMMGFGAYGGAGLGEGLMNAGASAMPGVEVPPIGADAAGAADMTKIYGNNPGSWGGASNAEVGITNTVNPSTTVNPSGAYNSLNLSQSAYTPNTFGGIEGTNVGQMYGAPPPATQVQLAAPAAPTNQIVDASKFDPHAYDVSSARMPTELKVPSKMDQLSAGFKDVTSSGTKAWDFVKEHPSPFIGLGVGALQEMQEQKAKDAAAAAAAGSGSPGMIRPYEYSVAQNESAYAPNASTAERNYFVQPRFIPQTPYAAKEGGLTSLAVGGAVEEMSARNAISDNTMYPQSQIQADIYSNPMVQRPMPNNVISAGIDAPTNTYTGEAKFADGGVAHYEIGGFAKAKPTEPTTDTKYAFDPATQQFTQTTTTTPAAKNQYFGGIGIPGFGFNPGMNNLTLRGMGSGTNIPLANIAGLFGVNNQAPQPTVTTETSGGIQTPYMQQAQPQTQPDNPIVPNINIPQPQDVNQQLGLQAFYPMMEQQLAAKGAQMQSQNMAVGGMAGGGYNLGGYSDGGRLLRGPGDGVSDSIPASIGNRQPARLADGEFVVPARIVSEIGNGSTEAGARKLYAMMDRVQKARGKTVGKNKVAVNTKAEKLLPA